MTRFSEALNKILTQKDISVYNLSQNSGVNRTTIQKMKAGTRLPASEAVVRQLADHLMLTPVEYNDFVRDYRISRMGEENYLRRQYVKEIIESFYDSHTVSNVVIESNGSNILHMPSDHEVVNGTYNVKRLIHAVLDNEANKKDGYVHMLTQPDFSYIYECISTIDFNKNHTPITNIISFDNMDTENTSLYNLRLFKALVPMLFTCENFEALCVHEYVSSVFNKTSLLPYKIFTSDYCLLISFEQETALIFQRGPVYDIIAHSFDQKRLLAQPIYKIIKANPQTYSEITPKFMDFKSLVNYSLLYQPSMPPFCDVQTMYSLINKDILTQELLQVWGKHFSNLNNYSGTLRSRAYASSSKLDRWWRFRPSCWIICPRRSSASRLCAISFRPSRPKESFPAYSKRPSSTCPCRSCWYAIPSRISCCTISIKRTASSSSRWRRSAC
jgi:hypothetical protein